MNEQSSTESPQAEQDLQNQFRLLAEEVEEYAIFLLDTEGHIISWNRGAEKIKGYSEEEILGRHFSTFYPEYAFEAGRPEEGLRVAATEGDWTDEGWRVRKDGTRFWARVTITALFDEEGTLQSYAKVTRDLTDRHRREEQLLAQKKQTENAKQQVLQAKREAEAARKQAERETTLLRLTQEVTAIANEAISLEGALERATAAVCDHIGWPVGHVYWRRPGSDRPLLSSNIWHVPGPGQFDVLRSISESSHFNVGESLPGLVAAREEPVWIKDVTQHPNFIRAKQANDLEVISAFAVPVQTDKDTVAVLEFFSAEQRAPDEKLMEVIGSVGTQLSRVAEREMAQKTLRESERRYRRLFEDSLEGIAITTREGAVLKANPAARSMLGYKQEDISDLNVNDLYVSSAEQKWVSAELERNGRVRDREVRFRRADGEEVICEVSVTVRPREEGKQELYQTFFRDVTERKRTQKALEESEAKFRTLAEGALVGIALIQDDCYEYLNPALAEITGYSRDALLGASLRNVVHPEDWTRVQKQIQQRITGKAEEVRYQARIQSKSGETRHVDVAGTQVAYQGRLAVLATIQDITEERRLQREILQVQEQERRRIGQDLHDGVASQLTGATLMLDTLKTQTEEECPKLTGRAEKVLDLVKESGEDLRRVSRGLNPVALEEGGLLGALERLAENTEGCKGEWTSLLEKRATLNKDEESHCYWIAQEAVANAKRHGRADEIIIRLQKEEDALILEIEDDGEGFEHSNVKDGIGLRTMRYRAELLGADITIDSAPGRGTLVRCRMPL
jgi:PAS domain S-box-containing protein